MVREVMVPRTEVDFLAGDMPVHRAVRGALYQRQLGARDQLGELLRLPDRHQDVALRADHGTTLEEYMRAIVGDDNSLWKPLPGFFTPDTPLYNEEGGDILKGNDGRDSRVGSDL